jgi:hypothetical protein
MAGRLITTIVAPSNLRKLRRDISGSGTAGSASGAAPALVGELLISIYLSHYLNKLCLRLACQKQPQTPGDLVHDSLDRCLSMERLAIFERDMQLILK